MDFQKRITELLFLKYELLYCRHQLVKYVTKYLRILYYYKHKKDFTKGLEKVQIDDQFQVTIFLIFDDRYYS